MDLFSSLKFLLLDNFSLCQVDINYIEQSVLHQGPEFDS